MRAMSAWARARDHIPHSLTEGVRPFQMKTGHQPWGPEQIRCVHEKLTGIVRRGVMLMLYTGQRGSDVVRLGWTDIEEGGFNLRHQQKTGRSVWCPIVPELAVEMQTWERRPGPFLQENGKLLNRKRLWDLFDKARADLPELQGFTPHGLRATAVIRLRRAGLETLQIQDIVGMSLAMIERYCRFADRKESGKAALVSLERTRQERQL
jgi:integrase